MPVATYFYLTIEHDRVVVKFTSTRGGADVTRPIKDVEDFRNFFTSKADEAKVPPETLTVMASSTMDFPEDFTKDQNTVLLARFINKSNRGPVKPKRRR